MTVTASAHDTLIADLQEYADQLAEVSQACTQPACSICVVRARRRQTLERAIVALSVQHCARCSRTHGPDCDLAFATCTCTPHADGWSQ